VDAQRIVQALPSAFFDRNRVPKDTVRAVVERAIGGSTFAEEARMLTTIVIGGSNYQVNVGAGASIVNSNLNIGEGSQIVVSTEADKDEVLVAVEAIIRAGLAGEWNDDAATALAEVIGRRGDFGYEDVQRVATSVVTAEQPTRAAAKDFLSRIAASGLGGVLATGMTTGVAEVMHLLPL
jgi:hypothetical protein